jgi:hypothetical protein
MPEFQLKPSKIYETEPKEIEFGSQIKAYEFVINEFILNIPRLSRRGQRGTKIGSC